MDERGRVYSLAEVSETSRFFGDSKNTREGSSLARAAASSDASRRRNNDGDDAERSSPHGRAREVVSATRTRP